MNSLWKFAENSFEIVTRGSFKLMNILITDHLARCTQFADDHPANTLLQDAQADTEAAYGDWTAAYTTWLTCRGLYKGATAAFYAKLEELGGLKIRQWDAAIQGVYLEGTPEYIALLPQGREPFQKGALESRVAAARSLGQALANYAPLAALMATVNTYVTQLDTLRLAQQQKETEVDTCSAAVETQRLATARVMYKNLARFMLVWWDNPVLIEDGFDMSYIRDGAPPPPEDEPEPPPPPTP